MNLKRDMCSFHSLDTPPPSQPRTGIKNFLGHPGKFGANRGNWENMGRSGEIWGNLRLPGAM